MLGKVISKLTEKEAAVKKTEGDCNLLFLKGEVLVRKLGILEGENVHSEEEMHALRHLLMERIGITELLGNSKRLQRLIKDRDKNDHELPSGQEMRLMFNLPGIVERLKGEFVVDWFVDPVNEHFVPIMPRAHFLEILTNTVCSRGPYDCEILAIRFTEGTRASTISFLEFLLHTKFSHRTRQACRALRMKFSGMNSLRIVVDNPSIEWSKKIDEKLIDAPKPCKLLLPISTLKKSSRGKKLDAVSYEFTETPQEFIDHSSTL